VIFVELMRLLPRTMKTTSSGCSCGVASVLREVFSMRMRVAFMASVSLSASVLVSGCAEDTAGSRDQRNPAGTAGVSSAGVSGGTSAAGSSAGSFVPMAGTNSFAGTGVIAGSGADGGDDCEAGVICAPTEPDPEHCGTLELKTDVEIIEMPGNVLMVFDRSGSMLDPWGVSTRWEAAGQAMVAALTPQQDLLTIGAVFFPSDQSLLSCLVEPIDTATQIAFQPGAAALAKMQTGGVNGTPMYQPGLGGTPTLEGLQGADAALNAATLSGTTVVILITDGDPVCAWNQGTAISLVSAWAAKGIKTYVLGVPGVGGQGVQTLNAVAAAGGTTSYIDPMDPATLAMNIQQIVESTVAKGIDSCTINFDPPTTVPEMLTLAITDMGMEQAVPHVYPNGDEAWEISDDGAVATLKGDFCEAAKSGIYESIRFVFGCEFLPPAPPPPGPE
jgi:hypothetical protein